MTEPGPNPLFAFRDVTVVAGGHTRLRARSLDIASGGITVITGPSGAGKSTLLRCCNRLVAPTTGRVLYRGTSLADIEPHEHRRQVGMVFQQPVPFPGTVAENLRTVADLDDGEVSELLERVALAPNVAQREATELSGGESQRMCLARTLTTRPSVLLADEPTSSLDPEAAETLERLARSLAESGTTVLWVTHDPAQAKRLGDRHLRLDQPPETAQL
ncbi:MAG: phosphate ABC transporter ATP-binding protein [Microthrixaceae bacterium]